MGDITPIGQHNIASVGHVGRNTVAADRAPGVMRASDKVELSTRAKLLDKLAQLPDVREDLIHRVQLEIEAGDYVTPDKIEAAIDEIASDIGDLG